MCGGGWISTLDVPNRDDFSSQIAANGIIDKELLPDSLHMELRWLCVAPGNNQNDHSQRSSRSYAVTLPATNSLFCVKKMKRRLTGTLKIRVPACGGAGSQ